MKKETNAQRNRPFCAHLLIDQIRRKQYPDCIAPYANRLLLVGINYDRQTKQHTCSIEEAAC